MSPNTTALDKAYVMDNIAMPVCAQDLMDAQIIPADTDYRMFSYDYYGSLPGVDVAFLLDSSAYHTHEDAPHRIRPGTVQVALCPRALAICPVTVRQCPHSGLSCHTFPQ